MELPSNKKVCPYCAGANGPATTTDHVIPKCVFVKPYPTDLITVRACEICNKEKSTDDIFLRDLIAIDYSAHYHPAVQHLFKKMRRAVRKNRSEVASLIQKQSPRVFRPKSKSGLHLPELAFEVEVGREERFHRMFQRIVQGLYYHHVQTIIPGSFDFDSQRIFPDDAFWNSLGKFNLRVGRKGDAVQYVCILAEEDRLSSVWIVSFYDAVHFMISALDPDIATDVTQRQEDA